MYNLMIKSQTLQGCFHGPESLDCGLHKFCLAFLFFFPSCATGGLEKDPLVQLPSVLKFGTGNSGSFLKKQGVVTWSGLLLGIFQNGYFPSPPVQNTGGFFFL